MPVTHITPHRLLTLNSGKEIPKADFAMLFNRPTFGEARLCQAIAPTKGLRKKGMRLKGSSCSLNGQLVLALIQASDTPRSVARMVQPVLMMAVLMRAFLMTRPWNISL